MKILLVSNNGSIGGGEIMLFNIARSLRSLNYEVNIIAPTQPGEVLGKARSEGFVAVGIPCRARKAYAINLRRYLKSAQYDYVWCNGLLPSLASTFIKRRIVHLHSLPSGLQSILARIAVFGVDHCLVPSWYVKNNLKFSTKVFYNWTEEIASHVDEKIITNSDVVEFLENRKKLIVGFLGRATLEKGIVTLIQALDLLFDSGLNIELIIGGVSRFESSGNEAIVRCAIDEARFPVKMVGWTSPQKLFDDVDMVVFPSMQNESFGLVVAEAMAYGIPFVMSNIGAFPEVAGPEYAFMATPGDAGDLANQVLALLTHDMHSQREYLRERWEEYFSPHAGLSRVSELISQIS